MTTQNTLGQHALNGVTDDAIYATLALAQFGGRVKALSTGVASIACINLISFFLASENHFGGVDDDYIVATINVRREVGFVFAADKLSYLRAKTAHYLVGSIDNHPLFLSRFLVGGNSLVT